MSKYLLFLLIFTISVGAFCSNTRFEYADYLFSQHQYSMAVAEYYRGMYGASDEDSLRAYFSIADCQMQEQKYIEASKTYEQIENRDKSNWRAISSHVKMLNNIHYYYESNKVIDQYISDLPQAHQDTLQIYYAVNLLNVGKFDQAKSRLESVVLEQNKPLAQFIELQMDENLPLPYKSQSKSALLQAVLPGAGYMYCHMPQTAIATLFVNMVIGYAIYDNLRLNNYGTGGFFAALGIGFYSGSIFGSMQAVTKYNKNVLAKFTNNIKLEENK